MAKSVLIAGAGPGGLATALRLAKKGFQVEIIEKNLAGMRKYLEKSKRLYNTFNP